MRWYVVHLKRNPDRRWFILSFSALIALASWQKKHPNLRAAVCVDFVCEIPSTSVHRRNPLW